MNTFTIDDIRKYNPCYNPSRYLPTNWSGTALDILDVEECPAKDRLWVVLNDNFIDKKVMQLFACECAEHVLHLFEDKYPNDNRPRKAIKAAREYISGNIDKDELIDCLNAAVYADADATDDAARAAAATSAAAAYSARAAVYIADASVVDATDDAARAAVYAVVDAVVDAVDAVVDAAVYAVALEERQWQIETLKNLIVEHER